MIGRVVLAADIVFLLSSCAPPYVPPAPDSPTALVRFSTAIGVNDNAYFLNVRQGPACKSTIGESLATLGAAFGNKKMPAVSMIGGSGKADRLRYDRVVEAGEPMYLYSQWASYNASCSTGAMVLLQPGKQYEISLAFGSGSCRIDLSELQERDGEVVRTERPVRRLYARKSTDLCLV